jgi:hypothetical protein
MPTHQALLVCKGYAKADYKELVAAHLCSNNTDGVHLTYPRLLLSSYLR